MHMQLPRAGVRDREPQAEFAAVDSQQRGMTRYRDSEVRRAASRQVHLRAVQEAGQPCQI